MKIYFAETNGANYVIITDGITAKIYDAAPTGYFDGVDIYADNAADMLREYYNRPDVSDNLNDFENIYCPYDNECDFDAIMHDVENSEDGDTEITLVYDDKF